MLGIAFKERHKPLGFSIRYLGYGGTDHQLELAIRASKTALSIVARSEEDRRLYHRLLGSSYLVKFEASGETEDIRQAIGHLEMALDTYDSSSDSEEDGLAVTFVLGYAHLQETMSTGNEESLDKALQETISSLPPDTKLRPAVLASLGCCYMRRYERLHSMEDLDSAIEICQQAITALPEDDMTRETLYGTLGRAYSYKHTRSNSPTYLDLSIQILEDACRVPVERKAVRVITNQTLALVYVWRYSLTASGADIDRAI